MKGSIKLLKFIPKDVYNYLIEIKKIKLSSEEYAMVDKRFGKNRECSFAKDKKGYYCYTHRARSKSYETINKIPMKDYKFICSTS